MPVAHLTTNSPPTLRLSIAEALNKIALTENEFCDRVTDAVPGEVIAYHVGMLAADRSLSVSTLPEGRRIELNAVANRALKLANAGGIVHLVDGVQQRAYDIRFWCIPVHRDRQRDPAMLEIIPQRRCWRIAEKAGQCRHVAPPTFDGPAVATVNVAVTDPAAFAA